MYALILTIMFNAMAVSTSQGPAIYETFDACTRAGLEHANKVAEMVKKSGYNYTTAVVATCSKKG